MTKTYTVHIELVEHFSFTVEANNRDEAEEKAWRVYPHHSPDYGESNITEITCEGEPT